MLTKRYMVTSKNLPDIFKKIREGTAPAKFTLSHFKGLGFKSSNDQPVIGILKDLKFLSDEGVPLPRYHAYRDPSRSKAIMAEALRDAYADLFHLNERPQPSDRAAIEGKFKSTHNVSDKLAEVQAKTFFTLLGLADLDAPKTLAVKAGVEPPREETPAGPKEKDEVTVRVSGLHYNIQIHLPPTKDIEVFNAIFRSLKEHLLAK